MYFMVFFWIQWMHFHLSFWYSYINHKQPVSILFLLKFAKFWIDYYMKYWHNFFGKGKMCWSPPPPPPPERHVQGWHGIMYFATPNQTPDPDTGTASNLNPLSTRLHQNVVWYNNSWLGFLKIQIYVPKEREKYTAKNEPSFVTVKCCDGS